MEDRDAQRGGDSLAADAAMPSAWDEKIDAFADHLKFESRRSDHTVRAYVGVENITDAEQVRARQNDVAVPGRVTTVGVRVGY